MLDPEHTYKFQIVEEPTKWGWFPTFMNSPYGPAAACALVIAVLSYWVTTDQAKIANQEVEVELYFKNKERFREIRGHLPTSEERKLFFMRAGGEAPDETKYTVTHLLDLYTARISAISTTDQGTEKSPDRFYYFAIKDYWEHSFDEWYSVTRLHSSIGAELWTGYYGPVLAEALRRKPEYAFVAFMEYAKRPTVNSGKSDPSETSAGSANMRLRLEFITEILRFDPEKPYRSASGDVRIVAEFQNYLRSECPMVFSGLDGNDPRADLKKQLLERLKAAVLPIPPPTKAATQSPPSAPAPSALPQKNS